MPRKAVEEDADKKSRLTLAQLAAYDDVSTDVMIDNVSTSSRYVVATSVVSIELTRSRHTGLTSEKPSARIEATSTFLCEYKMKQCLRFCFDSSLMEKM